MQFEEINTPFGQKLQAALPTDGHWKVSELMYDNTVYRQVDYIRPSGRANAHLVVGRTEGEMMDSFIESSKFNRLPADNALKVLALREEYRDG